MARLATGSLIIEKARKLLAEAKSIEELRCAQAVLLPLDFGMSLEETAKAIGVSKGWACQLRRALIKRQQQADLVVRSKRGSHRGRAYLSIQEERDFLLSFVEKAGKAGILIVNDIREALDKKLNQATSVATIYNLLHRHGWRKLAPDKRHPKVDVVAQQDWKKNFLQSYRKSTKTGKAKGVEDCV